MIIKKLSNVHICDFCDPESKTPVGYRHCQECNREACREHHNLITSFSHGVYFSGSGDAEYCDDCIEKLEKANDPRLAAFKKIQTLKLEAEEFQKTFKQRVETAERHAASFPPKFTKVYE